MTYAPVTALLRGLQVLETVNRLGPVSLTQVGQATDLPKASVLRALDTLRHGGYVVFEADTRRYLVAPRVQALANHYRPDAALLAAGAPIMQSLRETSGWPSDLAFYQAGKMAIADTNREPGTFSVNRGVGSRVSVMRTALGRAFVAFCSPDRRREILTELIRDRDADERGAADIDAVERSAEAIRARGYAVSDREFVPSLRAVAVPVMQDGAVRCAFNLITLADAMPMARFESTYIPLLLDARRRMEMALSGTQDAY